MDTKTCPKCMLDKPHNEWGKNKSKKDGLASWCRLCRKTYAETWYQDNKSLHVERVSRNTRARKERYYDFLIQYLQEHPCVDCGETDPIVLEFDHVRGVKKFNISNGVAERAAETVLSEIAKCDVRCANCHRRRSYVANGYTGKVNALERASLRGSETGITEGS